LVIGTEPRTIWDGGTTSDAAPDAPDAEAPCRLDQPFADLHLIDELSTSQNEESVRFSRDELEAWVSRRVQLNLVQTFRYARGSRTDSWKLAGEESDLNRFPDGSATSSVSLAPFPDELSAIVQYYDVPGSPSASLAFTQRTARGTGWGLPQPIPELDSGNQDNGPWLSQDGTELWFYSDRPSGWRVFHAVRSDAGWSTPEPMAISKFEDRSPVLTADALTIYLAATDLGQPGDTRKIYRAVRTSRTVDFPTPELVTELALPDSYAFPTWVSPDGCRLVWLANRNSLSTDVWTASKPPR
jgi:hypothetical protein